MTQAANYSAQRTTVDAVEIVRLADAAHHIEVSIAPSIGNIAYDMRVNGKPILAAPPGTLAEWKAKPSQAGIPFLAPWANRLDSDSFWANGKKYNLNPDVVNVRRDGRRMLYRTNAEAIRPLHEWTETFERFWRHQLSRVKERAEGKSNSSNDSGPNFIPGRKNDHNGNKN